MNLYVQLGILSGMVEYNELKTAVKVILVEWQNLEPCLWLQYKNEYAIFNA